MIIIISLIYIAPFRNPRILYRGKKRRKRRGQEQNPGGFDRSHCRARPEIPTEERQVLDQKQHLDEEEENVEPELTERRSLSSQESCLQKPERNDLTFPFFWQEGEIRDESVERAA